MTRVAVVKPDHLGDLILSSPAIRAAQKHFGAISLFVSDGARALAEHLFPEIELRSINFPHLSRGRHLDTDLESSASALNEFDLVLWLRNDPFIGQFSKQIKASQDFATGDFLTHETFIQKEMMLRHLKDYSRSQLFSADPIRWPERVHRVGLCIGSGFPHNRWPNVYWLQLAAKLSESGREIVLIAGPGEVQDAMLLSRCLRFNRIVVGSANFRAFLDDLEEIDLIIATDGGSAHICSLTKPILSIFGSSPWRRYAPFGRDNIVITRNLSCSPCCGFSMEEVNGCMTRECVVGLDPEVVVEYLSHCNIPKSNRLVVQRGTSHLN